jgi:signal transduction histidine kinase
MDFSLVNNPNGNQNKSALRVATRTFVLIMAVIFICESAIMVLLHLLDLEGPADILLDPILLSLLSMVPLYYMLLRPFRKALKQRQQTVQTLQAQNREIRAISETLQRNQKEMAQREKMVAIGTMAAGVAHEIGNPLTCLSAVVQLLERNRRCEKNREQLAILNEQIGRIVKIVRELLEFAKPDAGRRTLVDLDEITERTIRMVRYNHRSQHAVIDSRRNDSLPNIYTVPEQFQQVLVNLLLNALDAIKEVQGNPPIIIERTVEDGRVAIKVIDQGVGMTEEQVRQAFEPFYTTKSPAEGTGLGLAVSYRIVEALGGRIMIESSPGAGTVVTVLFPAVDTTVDSATTSNEQNALHT